MIERALDGVTVVGAVRGLVAEGDRVRARLDGLRPQAVGLAISPDELKGLREYFVGPPTEPVVPLAPTEAGEVRALARYGEVGVPNPTAVEVIRWSDSAGVAVEALDPTDDDYAEWFAETISYVELVRRTLRERRVVKNPPKPPTADEFATAWNHAINHGAGSRRLARRRDAAVVDGLGRLRAQYASVVLLVDRERFEGVVGRLGDGFAAVRTPADEAYGASR
ncbi:MAG TPA: hypothetical protein VGP88_09620 [Thermoplasmata archaeon]|nr:hypothetical protein [Thermoplasmata archaeon]